MALKISSYLFYLLSVITIAFGGLYFLRTDIMPYHYSFLQVSSSQINAFNPNVIELMLAFMKIIGSSYIGIGTAVILITKIGILKNKAWAWWSILLVMSFPLAVTYWITVMVSLNIEEGPKPPWCLALGMLILLVLALILSFKILKKE